MSLIPSLTFFNAAHRQASHAMVPVRTEPSEHDVIGQPSATNNSSLTLIAFANVACLRGPDTSRFPRTQATRTMSARLRNCCPVQHVGALAPSVQGALTSRSWTMPSRGASPCTALLAMLNDTLQVDGIYRTESEAEKDHSRPLQETDMAKCLRADHHLDYATTSLRVLLGPSHQAPVDALTDQDARS